MVIIGVTGGVGTGKSTVAKIFRKLGATVLDADRITHELLDPGTEVFRKIRARFGESVLTARGAIDRRRLGALVFRDPKRLRWLTAILHPAVRREIHKRLGKIRRQNSKAVVVLDVPLLIEAGNAYRLDALVVVSAPLKTVARRLKERSGWSFGELKARQAFQMPLREKEQRADFVVRNEGSLASTRRQAIQVWKQMVKENG